MKTSMIIAIISAVAMIITGIISSYVTAKIARKSQIEKNTESIQKLIENIGLDGKQTLANALAGQYFRIKEDIGRGEHASLTRQHMELEECIRENYKKIEDRYEKEDASYRLFNARETDLTETMKNFVKDYENVISEKNTLSIENHELREEMEELKKKNTDLTKKIKVLQRERDGRSPR